MCIRLVHQEHVESASRASDLALLSRFVHNDQHGAKDALSGVPFDFGGKPAQIRLTAKKKFKAISEESVVSLNRDRASHW